MQTTPSTQDLSSQPALAFIYGFLDESMVRPSIKAMEMNSDPHVDYTEQEWRTNLWDPVLRDNQDRQTKNSPLSNRSLSQSLAAHIATLESGDLDVLEASISAAMARMRTSTLDSVSAAPGSWKRAESGGQSREIQAVENMMETITESDDESYGDSSQPESPDTHPESSFSSPSNFSTISHSESGTLPDLLLPESMQATTLDDLFLANELRKVIIQFGGQTLSSNQISYFNRAEIVINYPRFSEYDRLQSIATSGRNVSTKSVHTRSGGYEVHGQYSNILQSQTVLLETLQGPSKKLVPGDILWRLDQRVNNAIKAIGVLNTDLGLDKALQDFTNVLPEYPIEGRVDALLSLRDDDFFSRLIQVFNGNKTRAKSFLNKFRCLHVKPKNHSYPPPLYIPYFLMEYKKDHKSKGSSPEQTAHNQRAMYCLSAVRFLEALGITDYTVYGGATSGSTITFCAAWVSSADLVCIKKYWKQTTIDKYSYYSCAISPMVVQKAHLIWQNWRTLSNSMSSCTRYAQKRRNYWFPSTRRVETIYSRRLQH